MKRSSTAWLLGGFVLASVGACGGRQASDEASETRAATSTETETETGAEEGEGDACSCVDLDQVCGGQALDDCDLPHPCGIVDGSPAPATCVLELLIEQQPARFAYDISKDNGLGTDRWTGWFYILGPKDGIDSECYEQWLDFSYTMKTTVKPFTIEDPAYFEACLGESPSTMTGCIFNGVDADGLMAFVPECEG